MTNKVITGDETSPYMLAGYRANILMEPGIRNISMIPNVLSIAGSDPSGGAGIQADLKTFSALGAYGMAVITALTAQNTMGVNGIHQVPAEFIASQIDTVFSDVRVSSTKVGMLGTAGAAAAVCEALKRNHADNIVLDPVMVAKGGAVLMDEQASDEIRSCLMPLASVITPNLPEAGVLLKTDPPGSIDEMKEAAMGLHRLGPGYVLLKGGHLGSGDSTDVLYDGKTFYMLEAERINTRNTHGTGCTLSSAIAALMPGRPDMAGVVREAKAFISGAIKAADMLDVGSGHGPVHHFHDLWSEK